MKKVEGSIQMTHDEWTARGAELFGENVLQWKFVCPMCGNVQTAEDFRPFKDKGASPSSVNQECIGRYYPKEMRGGLSEDHANNKVKQPCDYAGYGLFRLSPVHVKLPTGEVIRSFAFAEEKQDEAVNG